MMVLVVLLLLASVASATPRLLSSEDVEQYPEIERVAASDTSRIAALMRAAQPFVVPSLVPEVPPLLLVPRGC